MASTTTRKRTSRKAVETPVAETESGTDLAVIDAPEAPAEVVIDPANVKLLIDLTEVAKTGIETAVEKSDEAAEAFRQAAEAVREIREGDLVSLAGATHPETGEPFTFDTYVEFYFGVSRDLGDKYVRAAEVVERLRKELSAEQVEQYGLPSSEGQARPLAFALKADPNSDKLLTSSIWVESHTVAEKRVKDAAEKKGTGFVPKRVEVTVRDVANAREIVAPKPVKKAPPKPKLGQDADPLAKKIVALAKQFPGVHFDQFFDLLVEGVKLNATVEEIKAQRDAVRPVVTGKK